MSLKERAIRGSLVLMIGEGLVYGCSFVRNMILARMLTKGDFGISATFSLIMTLLEMSDKLGMARFVVRDREGNDPEFVSAAHLVHFVVAASSCIAIVAFAGPLSVLFGIPGQQWAIALLALGPLFRGLEHLDIRRYERNLRFVPSLLVEIVPQVVLTILAWPVASWLGDYRAVLLLLLAKGLATCIASHVMAERRYTWRFHRPYVTRMLRFGWPLVVNGFLTFGALQGDQFLIAARYTMADLAPYAAAAALNMAPSFLFTRVLNTLMLPILAEVQDNSIAINRRYGHVLALVTLFAIVCAVAMILGGEAIMRLVYGAKYAGAGALLAWLAASNAFRNVRIASALAAIAKGDSQNPMISNAWRVASLGPAVLLAVRHAPLWSIACVGLGGEALACWASFVRLRRRDGIPLFRNVVYTLGVLGAVGMAGALAFGGVHLLPTNAGLLLAAIGVIASGAVGVAAIPELRSEAMTLYTLQRRGGLSAGINDFLSLQKSPVATGGVIAFHHEQSEHMGFRVGLMGASLHTENRGVSALGASLATLIWRERPNARISLLIGNADDSPALVRTGRGTKSVDTVNYRLSLRASVARQLWWIVVASALYRLIPVTVVRKWIMRTTPWVRAVAEADFIGDMRGGDSFSDIYGVGSFVVDCLPVLSVIWVRGGIHMLPQTYGPFRSGLAEWFARHILLHSDTIWCRDHVSVREVSRLTRGRRTGLLCPDVAFVLEPVRPPRVCTDPPLDAQQDQTLIGLNVSGLLYYRPRVRENAFGLRLRYRECVVRIAEQFLADESVRLVLIPHTFGGGGGSDADACEDVRQRLSEALKHRVHVVNREYDQHELKGIIARCDFFVGSRMHACIAALSQGVPTVGVAYSRKFSGVFDTIGQVESVIDGRFADVEEALTRIARIYKHRDPARSAALRTNVAAAQGQLHTVFERLVGVRSDAVKHAVQERFQAGLAAVPRADVSATALSMPRTEL